MNEKLFLLELSPGTSAPRSRKGVEWAGVLLITGSFSLSQAYFET